MTSRATSPRLDGDQATSVPFTATFDICPVIDGVASWNMRTTVSENASEAGGEGVSLRSAPNYRLSDHDGSESVVSSRVDLLRFFADAGFAVRVQALSGTGAGLADLVAELSMILSPALPRLRRSPSTG
jgi:hypothetical protein